MRGVSLASFGTPLVRAGVRVKVRVRVRARARVRVRVRLLGLGIGLANPNPSPSPEQVHADGSAEVNPACHSERSRAVVEQAWGGGSG